MIDIGDEDMGEMSVKRRLLEINMNTSMANDALDSPVMPNLVRSKTLLKESLKLAFELPGTREYKSLQDGLITQLAKLEKIISIMQNTQTH